MKILHVYKCALPDSVGGVEVVIDTLASKQAARGHDVEVVAVSKNRVSRSVEKNGYKVHFLKPLFSLFSNPFSYEFFLFLRNNLSRFDVVNLHAPYPFAELCLVITGHAKGAVVTYHSDVVRQRLLMPVYWPIREYFFKQISEIIATSPNYVTTSKVLQKHQNKVSVIPLGVSDFSLEDHKKLQNFDYDTPYFFFVGAFRYYKGLFTLIRSAQYTSARIVIAGEGSLEGKLKKEVTKLRLKNVIFVGPLTTTQKVTFLRFAYAIVLPSILRSEAFGLALLEGAMFGKPLISCEIGTGTSFVNKNAVTGIVVPPNDPKKLAEAMDRLVSNPPMARRFGNNSRKRYLDLLQADLMVDQYLAKYGAREVN